MESHGSKPQSKDRSRETGEALVLLALLAFAKFKASYLLILAIVLLLACLLNPKFFRPVSPLWFGLGEVLGRFTSRIILTVIFFVVIVPVSLLQRLAGRDVLGLKMFKRGTESAMVRRDHEVTAADLENSF